MFVITPTPGMARRASVLISPRPLMPISMMAALWRLSISGT